jgi:hypothetical protein
MRSNQLLNDNFSILRYTQPLSVSLLRVDLLRNLSVLGSIVMAVYNEDEFLNKTLVCKICGEEKPLKKFDNKFYKPSQKYHVNQRCATCHYRQKRKVYADRNEDYCAKQRFKEVFTIPGRALLMRNRCKVRGKRDNIHFNLSKQVLIDKLTNGKCEITGIDLFIGELTLHPYAPSIDRINSEFGYTDDNIRVVCMIYNFCKNEFSEEQVKDFIFKAYKNINGKYFPDTL